MFTDRRPVPNLGPDVLPLGVAGNYGIDSDDIRHAAGRGVNYWLFGARFNKVTNGIRDVIRKDRDQHVVAHLASLTTFGWQVRRQVEGVLKKLDTDYIDLFQLGWLGTASRLTPAISDAVAELKEEGKVRAFGTSIHDRERAGRLAVDSPLDALMIRYNAKHPGAEQDIFPHLAARNPAVIAYTALAWGQLIRPLKGMDMPPFPGTDAPLAALTPELAYRFVLSNPHVHVTLTGPKDRAQLDANLDCLAQGPLNEEEMAWVRDYGRRVKALKKLDYV